MSGDLSLRFAVHQPIAVLQFDPSSLAPE
jgi:hypothetical protein